MDTSKSHQRKRAFWELLEDASEKRGTIVTEPAISRPASSSKDRAPLRVLSVHADRRSFLLEGLPKGPSRWAVFLQRSLGLRPDEQRQPVLCRTCCSGTGAPIIALKARPTAQLE